VAVSPLSHLWRRASYCGARDIRLISLHSVGQTYLAGGAVLRVGLQEFSNEELGILADILPVPLMENDSAVAALLNEIGQALAAEWRVSTEQGVGDNTERPHIHSLSVSFLKHDLRRSISERTRHGVEHGIPGIEHLCDTEIREHQGRIGIGSEVEKVLGLQVCDWRLSL
jgi:hypothetical protein